MTGMPTGTVKLDDGSGTYPIDITSLVELEEGITVSAYGRVDEFDQAQAATLELVLNNTDGALTVGSAGLGFGLGGFGLGGFGGASGGGLLQPGMGIRFTETFGATTRNRFTGRLSTLDLNWPGGGDKFSLVGVTAVDVLADAGRKILRSMLEEEILLRSPSAHYTLGEAEGSTAAGDTSGNQAAPLTVVGTGAPVVFGNGTGPVDGLSAAQFAAGKYLSIGTGNPIFPPTTFGIGGAFAVPAGSSGQLFRSQGWQINIQSPGHVQANVPGGGGILDAGDWDDEATHMVFLVGDGTTASLIVDGGVVGTVGISGGTDIDFTQVGSAGLIGTLSHLVTFPSLSVADAQFLSTVGLGDLTETTSQRFARLASYGGIITTTSAYMSGQVMGAQATSGQSLADALQAVADAEGGVMYVSGDGSINLQGRYLRGHQLTPTATFPSLDVGGDDTAVTLDTFQKINQVTVTRTNGATQIYSSATVQADITEPIFPASLEVAVDTDDNALLAAQWLVNKHETPTPRLGTATFLAHESPNAEAILQLEPGTRIALSPMPAQLWSTSGDVTVEGWSETLTDTSWVVAANLLPWALFQAGIYDDAGSLYDTAVYA